MILATLEPLETVEEPSEEEAEEVKEEEEGEPVSEEILLAPEIIFEPQAAEEKPQLRFAEDIMAPRRAKTAAKSGKSKKKKKVVYSKDTGEDGVKTRKGRRDFEITEEEDYF